MGAEPEQLRARLAREPGNFRQIVFLAGMDALLGRKAEALRGVDQAVQLMPMSRDAVDGATYAYYRAITYDIAGEKEVALAEYARLLRVPGSQVRVHGLRRAYSTLHGDPRFEALLNDPQNNAPLF